MSAAGEEHVVCRLITTKTEVGELREHVACGLAVYGEDRSKWPVDWLRRIGAELVVRAEDHRTMAHVMHAIGAFPSVSEARRAGRTGPVVKGRSIIKIRGSRYWLVIE